MASCTRCPRCQSTLTSGEVSVDLKNKGRWYWSCSSARCRYFRWDEPLHPFIQYSPEVYQSVSHAPPSKFARQLSYYNKEDGYVELPRTKTRFAFSLISETQIALKATLTATLEPLVRSIPHIRYDEQHDHWVMPASEGAYSRVLKMLPVQTPNLQIDIDGIPINMLKEMTKGKRNGLHEFRDLEEREIETHLMDLLELPYYSKLKSFQKEGIKKGVEQHGRVLLGNEYGIGLVEEAVVLSQLYEKDNPVLILCPSHMMSTWKDEMVRIFDMDPHTIKIIRKKKGMFDAPIVIRKIRQRKRKRVRILKQVFIEHGTRDFTDPIMLEESYEDGYEYITEQYTPTIRYYLMDYFDAIQCSDRILERRFGTVIMDGSQCLKHNNRINESTQKSHPTE
ncbi:hypothetical protein BDB01DRAFT_405369 [Pilobolus umbonatus]|nr:hypothetical protein BDB01DRAFT_405369 [Pilobolus umbonatus]